MTLGEWLKGDEFWFPLLMLVAGVASLVFQSLLQKFAEKYQGSFDSSRAHILSEVTGRMQSRRVLSWVLMLVGFVWLMQSFVQTAWAR